MSTILSDPGWGGGLANLGVEEKRRWAVIYRADEREGAEESPPGMVERTVLVVVGAVRRKVIVFKRKKNRRNACL